MKSFLKLSSLFALLLVLTFSCVPVSDQQTTSDGSENVEGEGGTGCTIKKEEYEKAPIFVSPDFDLEKNGLPPKVSLLAHAPKRKNQGLQSSCVGWASSYAARTILESVSTGKNPNDVPFSPSYIYNQIRQGDCSVGSYLRDALEKLRRQGTVPYKDFPYVADRCDRKPAQPELQKASEFRIEGYTRLTRDMGFDIDLQAMKHNLACKAPILIAMPVGGTFYKLKSRFWKPTQNDFSRLALFKAGQIEASGLGGHAMCAIGYDDAKGTVEVMNSWGEEWGDKGIFEMSAKDFEQWCMEAYGYYPMRQVAVEKEQADFKAKFGIRTIQNKKASYLPLNYQSGYTLTAQARKGTKFKIEADNTMPFYLYIIGQETDMSSYVLFPYTPKHSPYVGTTGARLFPKDKTLFLDPKGTEDVFAVLLSKTELNIDSISRAVTASKAVDYEAKIKEVLAKDLIDSKQISFQPGELITAQVAKTDKKVIPLVIKIKK